MDSYSEILNAFKTEGIKSEKALATALRKFPEKGGGTASYYSSSFGKQNPLGHKFYYALYNLASRIDDLYHSGGIQQFSLNIEPQIREEYVHKSLFLSNIATIFTKHSFSYTTHNYLAEDEGQEYIDESWNISPDFIRTVFRYRKAIERGYLIILPQSVEEIATDCFDIPRTLRSENRHLLRELERIRVLSLDTDTQLIDLILSRYRMNNQLISLPDLNVPWIKNLNTKKILEIKDDNGYLIDRFQRAYHKAIQTYIENHKTLDFEKISDQINNDIIVPNLKRIENDYKKIISHHRSLMLLGATISLIPISGLILSQYLLSQILVSDIIKLLPTAISGLASSIAINKINQKHSIQSLDDNEFYILWKIKNEN